MPPCRLCPLPRAPANCLLPRKKPLRGRGALQVAVWGETHLLHGETAGDVHLRCVFWGCRACVVQQLGLGGRWEALVCLRAARGENQAALGPGSGRMARRGGGTQPGRGSSSPRPGAELGAQRRQLSSRAEHCSVLLPPPFCCLELLPGQVKLCSLPEPAGCMSSSPGDATRPAVPAGGTRLALAIPGFSSSLLLREGARCFATVPWLRGQKPWPAWFVRQEERWLQGAELR